MRKRVSRFVGLSLVVLLLLSLLITPAYADMPEITSITPITPITPITTGDKVLDKLEYAPGQLIVKFKPDLSQKEKENLKRLNGLETIRNHPATGSELLSIKENVKLEQILTQLKKNPIVVYAEPNYRVKTDTVNDPLFGNLWGLHNTGQYIYGYGTPDIDIDAPEAWGITQGSKEIVVAVIDEGVDINHPDLAPNIWHNPGEIAGDGIDNDGNGYIDDINGWDFYHYDNTVFDSADGDEHGTHVAGTIAALANNSTGVAGVAPNVKIMPLKFLGPGGGYTSDAILAIEYAAKMGAHLSSNSWGGGGFSTSLSDAISNFNGVFVAAAGNDGVNTDVSPHYPSSYSNSNIISVAAINNQGGLAYFSNYGVNTVDVGAPGVDIYSLSPGSGYQYMSGTSMATPHVSGVVALMLSVNPALSSLQITEVLKHSAVPIASLQGKTVTGALANAHEAVLTVQGGGPFVIGTNPPDQYTGFTGEKPITVTFNETVFQGFEYNLIQLIANDSLAAVPSTKTLSGNVLTITPETLSNNTTYSVNIPANAVMNQSGASMIMDYAFSFSTPDTLAPEVISTDPLDGATNVPVEQMVSIKFSEPISEGVNYSQITVNGELSGTSFGLRSNGNVLNITPYGNYGFNYNTDYEVIIPSGAVKDPSGNALEQPYSFSFRTSNDTIPPEAYYTEPQNGSTGLPLNATPIVYFTEEIVPGPNYEAIRFDTNDGSGSIEVGANIDRDILTITPLTALAPNTTYSVTIPADAVKDLNGNSLVIPFTLSYTTIVYDVLGLPFPVSDAVMDPDPEKDILYMIDGYNAKLYALNYTTGDTSELDLTYAPVGLELGQGQFADEIYVLLKNTEPNPYEVRESLGNIAVVDRFTFTLKGTYPIATDPFDLVAGRDGYLYVAPASDQWTNIDSYCRTETGLTLTHQSGIRHQSYTKLHPTLERIYTIDTDLSPRDYHAYNTNQGMFTDPTYPGGYDSPYHGEYSLNENFAIDPTGNYLFNGNGIIFTTAADKVQDMLYAGKLDDPFNDITFEPDLSRFYTVPINGEWANVYNGTDFRIIEHLKLADRGQFIFKKGNKLITLLDPSMPTYSYQTGVQILDIPVIPDPAPVITGSIPASGAINVKVDQEISVNFSETVNIESMFENITLSETPNSTVPPTPLLTSKTLTGNVLSIQPSSNLEYSTAYTLTIPKGSVADLTGNPLAEDTVITFTTEAEPDGTSPAVTGSTPEEGAVVPITQTMTLTFSEDVYAGNTFDSIRFTNSTHQELTLTKSFDGNQLFLTPTDLAYSMSYTLTLPSGAVQDSSGNQLLTQYTLTFSTEDEPDHTAPTVTESDPANNASSIPVDKVLIITFSEEVTAGKVFDGITLKEVNALTPLTISKLINGNTLTLTSASNFNFDTTYTLSIPAGAVQDKAGNSLANEERLDFTTELASDTMAPSIVNTVPAANEKDVNVSSLITITFNENIKLGSTAGDISLMRGKKRESYTLSISGTMLTIIPNALLPRSTYTLTLPQGAILDMSGNSCNAYSLVFSTSKK